MKLWKQIALGLLLVIAAYAVFAIVEIRSLEVEKISDDLHVIRGLGGNSTVLRTDAGAVVIDSMTFVMQGQLIREKVVELTGSEPVLIINTHYHLDHTHGNPAFAPGTRVVSTERTLSHLKVLDGEFWTDEAAQLLPNETFSDRQTLNIGGKTLQLIHPGRGHTDGDLVVLIEEENAVVMGDLFFNHYYPNIDLEAGGSVQEWSATLEEVLQSEFDHVIPGHGATSNRLGLHDYQRFMGQLAGIGRAAVADGLNLDETLSTAQLTADKDYETIHFVGVSLGLDREFVLTRAWQEATNNFELKN
jgi:glyoxylase-like metal-dependent hydrolase (beta-lactamase superfamily II)